MADEGPFPGGEVIEVSKEGLDELPIIVFEGKTPNCFETGSLPTPTKSPNSMICG
mgnify:CR=1 FL=1